MQMLLLTHRCLKYVFTFTDEEFSLPSVSINNFSRLIVTFQGSFQLNCTGDGSVLRWYRSNLDTPLDNYTQLVENNTLILNIYNVTEDIDATRSGIPYFCTSRNLLGVVRSRSVLVRYASKLYLYIVVRT